MGLNKPQHTDEGLNYQGLTYLTQTDCKVYETLFYTSRKDTVAFFNNNIINTINS